LNASAVSAGLRLVAEQEIPRRGQVFILAEQHHLVAGIHPKIRPGVGDDVAVSLHLDHRATEARRNSEPGDAVVETKPPGFQTLVERDARAGAIIPPRAAGVRRAPTVGIVEPRQERARPSRQCLEKHTSRQTERHRVKEPHSLVGEAGKAPLRLDAPAVPQTRSDARNTSS